MDNPHGSERRKYSRYAAIAPRPTAPGYSSVGDEDLSPDQAPVGPARGAAAAGATLLDRAPMAGDVARVEVEALGPKNRMLAGGFSVSEPLLTRRRRLADGAFAKGRLGGRRVSRISRLFVTCQCFAPGNRTAPRRSTA